VASPTLPPAIRCGTPMRPIGWHAGGRGASFRHGWATSAPGPRPAPPLSRLRPGRSCRPPATPAWPTAEPSGVRSCPRWRRSGGARAATPWTALGSRGCPVLGGRWPRWSTAGPTPSVGTGDRVTPAGRSTLSPTPAASAVVRQATATTPKPGGQHGVRNACRSPPGLSSAPGPRSCGSSSATTSTTSTTASAERRRSRSARWPRTRMPWGACSGFWVCGPPGPGPSPTIHTGPVWGPPGGARLTTTSGGRLARRPSGRCGPSRTCAAVGSGPGYTRSAPICTVPRRSGPPTGSSRVNRRGQARKQGSTTWADTSIASP
jgi:hypothetical protein